MMEMIVRSQSSRLIPNLQQTIQKRLEYGLGRFKRFIDRVTVTLVDVNGPRGGQDQHCDIKVTLHTSGVIVGKATEVDILLAVSRAMERVVRQIKERRQARLDRRVGVGRFQDLSDLQS
jgi:ribosomal subunit interface protein